MRPHTGQWDECGDNKWFRVKQTPVLDTVHLGKFRWLYFLKEHGFRASEIASGCELSLHYQPPPTVNEPRLVTVAGRISVRTWPLPFFFF